MYLIKVTLKTCYKLFIFQKKILLNFLFFQESWKILSYGFHRNIINNIKLHDFFTLMIIINVSWEANQHINMISEGSCDTEDWSNASQE